MKFLHSADWHLGSTLHECRRTEQFGKMLDGMRRVIEEESVDVLLLSGDVFDTAGPPVSAQKQYYSFLASLRESGCRGAVVIAGNHDSPALLGASSAILDRLAIHVVSRPGEEENAIIPLGEALVIAVPYLRESDVDSYISGATAEEQRQSFVAHVTSLLSHLSDEAERRYPGVPQIVMSHSFISGSAIYDGQEERDYVGNLGSLPPSIFPSRASYVALGHIHRPQRVAKSDFMRYSGSPLPISFREAGREKSCEIITVEGGKTTARSRTLPPFCDLRSIRGDIDELEEQLFSLRDEEAWIEAIYTGEKRVANLRERLLKVVEGGSARVLKVIDQGLCRALTEEREEMDITTLTEEQVFLLRLDEEKEIEKEQRERLVALFGKVLREGGRDENL